jgi:hypothetical protein
VWQLVRGDELLAELVVSGGDFPWLNAEVRSAAGFAEVRPLFDDELRWADRIGHRAGRRNSVRKGLESERDLNSRASDLRRCRSSSSRERISTGQRHTTVSEGFECAVARKTTVSVMYWLTVPGRGFTPPGDRAGD